MSPSPSRSRYAHIKGQACSCSVVCGPQRRLHALDLLPALGLKWDAGSQLVSAHLSRSRSPVRARSDTPKSRSRSREPLPFLLPLCRSVPHSSKRRACPGGAHAAPTTPWGTYTIGLHGDAAAAAAEPQSTAAQEDAAAAAAAALACCAHSRMSAEVPAACFAAAAAACPLTC